MAGNTTQQGAGFSTAAEFAAYDALPSVVKKAFQDAPADFSVAGLIPYGPTQRMRKVCTDEEYAAWLTEQFMHVYQQTILPKALEEPCNLSET